MSLAIVFALCSCSRSEETRGLERWFVPGPLGHEPGVSLVRFSKRAFLTRVLAIGMESGGQEWSRRNHLTEPLAHSHNLADLFPPALYAEHPEFFPLVGDKRYQPGNGPAYWNPDLGRPDVAIHAAKMAMDYFADHPDTPSFSLAINDALLFGESAETLALVSPPKWFRQRPDYSNLVFTFTNRAADAVAGTHPNKLLGALAYYWAENAPDFPLKPQVVPILTADRSQGYDETFRWEELELQNRWSKAATRRLGLHDYVNGGGFLIPRIHTRLLAENLRHARRAGFTDYYAEVVPNWGLDGPMPWLVAQLVLDPEQSPEVLLDEYYRRYFRTAAVPMRRFIERCERQWMTQAGSSYWLKHYRNESQATIFPSAVCRELRALLTDAARVAGEAARTGWVDGDGARQRVKLVSDAFGVTERFVAMQEAREQLNQLSFAAAPKWRDLVTGVSRFVKARDELTDYTNRLRDTSPLAVAGFSWEDYLRHDPVPNALVRLRAGAQAEGKMDQANTAIAGARSEELNEAWALCIEADRMRGIRLVRNGGLAGEVRPARRIAGLDYGVALPEGWESAVEPVEFQRAELRAETGDGRWKLGDGDEAAVKADRGKLKAETGNLKPENRRSREAKEVPPQVRPEANAEGGQSVRPVGSDSHKFESGDLSADSGNPQVSSFKSQDTSAPARVLRLTGNKETSVYQWNTPKAERVHVASVKVRGHVSPSAVVSLTFGFLDGQQQRLELKTLRLPEGDWPEWVTLRLIERSPPGAKWVGIGVRVQSQVVGDWAEVKEFELTAH